MALDLAEAAKTTLCIRGAAGGSPGAPPARIVTTVNHVTGIYGSGEAGTCGL